MALMAAPRAALEALTVGPASVSPSWLDSEADVNTSLTRVSSPLTWSAFWGCSPLKSSSMTATKLSIQLAQEGVERVGSVLHTLAFLVPWDFGSMRENLLRRSKFLQIRSVQHAFPGLPGENIAASADCEDQAYRTKIRACGLRKAMTRDLAIGSH